jgi:hypothetical protein
MAAPAALCLTFSWPWGPFPEQVALYRQAAQDANAKPVLMVAEQKKLEKLRVHRTSGRSGRSTRSCISRRRPWRRRQHC